MAQARTAEDRESRRGRRGGCRAGERRHADAGVVRMWDRGVGVSGDGRAPARLVLYSLSCSVWLSPRVTSPSSSPFMQDGG